MAKKRLTPQQWEDAYEDTLAAIEKAAEEQELSFYRIGIDTGVAPAILSRLRSREGTLSTENLYRLLIYFDMLPAI